MAVLVRVVLTAFPGIANDWRQILTFVSIASMVLGAFAAIGQRNFKRLMAYSAIGHMGYALVGLAAGTVEGAQSVVIYMAIYVVMTLGTFAAILSMRRAGRAVETMADLAGLARTDPTMAFFLATMMFSLAGVPPLAGFFAKFYVFAAAMKAGLYGLSVIGVLASCVAAYYYLRIVKLMYFDEPAPAFDRPSPVARIVLAVSALAIILFVFAPSSITNAAMAAAQSLF
jgi:NADH-quinone oxidoreductase subunit N